MIDRYSRKELKNIWSEENKYRIWLNIEIAAAEAMEKYKFIPKGVSSIVKRKAKIKVKRIHEDNKKRQTVFWLARDWDFVLVKLNHRDKKETYSIEILRGFVSGNEIK